MSKGHQSIVVTTSPARVLPGASVDGSALTPPSPVRVLVSVLANADRPRRMASNYVALELNVFNTPDVDAG